MGFIIYINKVMVVSILGSLPVTTKPYQKQVNFLFLVNIFAAFSSISIDDSVQFTAQWTIGRCLFCTPVFKKDDQGLMSFSSGNH